MTIREYLSKWNVSLPFPVSHLDADADISTPVLEGLGLHVKQTVTAVSESVLFIECAYEELGSKSITYMVEGNRFHAGQVTDDTYYLSGTSDNMFKVYVVNPTDDGYVMDAKVLDLKSRRASGWLPAVNIGSSTMQAIKSMQPEKAYKELDSLYKSIASYDIKDALKAYNVDTSEYSGRVPFIINHFEDDFRNHSDVEHTYMFYEPDILKYTYVDDSPAQTGGWQAIKYLWKGKTYDGSSISDYSGALVINDVLYVFELDDCCAEQTLSVTKAIAEDEDPETVTVYYLPLNYKQYQELQALPIDVKTQYIKYAISKGAYKTRVLSTSV